MLHSFNPEEDLRLHEDWPQPTRHPGEVLVRVVSTSVNRSVYKTRDGFMPQFLTTLPKVLQALAALLRPANLCFTRACG